MFWCCTRAVACPTAKSDPAVVSRCPREGRGGPIRRARHRHRRGRLLCNPRSFVTHTALAARHQREHQRPHRPIPPKRHRPQPPRPDPARRDRRRHGQVTNRGDLGPPTPGHGSVPRPGPAPSLSRPLALISPVILDRDPTGTTGSFEPNRHRTATGGSPQPATAAEPITAPFPTLIRRCDSKGLYRHRGPPPRLNRVGEPLIVLRPLLQLQPPNERQPPRRIPPPPSSHRTSRFELPNPLARNDATIT